MLLSLLFPTVVLALYLLVAGLGSVVCALAWVLAAVVAAAILLRCWFSLVAPPVAKGTIGFFHPNANGGGGGERVLWCAAAAVQEAFPNQQIVIYTGDGLSSEELLANARRAFSMPLPQRITVMHLRRAELLEAARYPRCTLVRQALGSVRVALDALRLLRPEVFLDTAGWAFSYPLARAAGCRVASYTHYPTVSADMLVQQVGSGAASFNNQREVAGNRALTILKMMYYYCFATLYGAAGGCAHAVMTNSSWTADHVAQLFWSWQLPAVVHPPCDTAELSRLPLQRKLKRLYLVSLAQFRPEKDHSMQLRAFSRARRRARAFSGSSPATMLSARLKLIGGCRNAEDEARVAALRQEAVRLDIADFVDFHVNASWDEVKLLLGEAVGGLHTMVDEHFGIGIVQYMAAGVVPIVNNSGGPRMDILHSLDCSLDAFSEPRSCGYLCSTESEYADAIAEVVALEGSVRGRLAAAARRSAARFSDRAFRAAFLDALLPALPRGF